MTTTDDQIRQLKAQIGLVAQKKAQVAVQQSTAEATVQRSLERLRTEYGVETQADGQRVMQELQTQLATAIQETESALERTHS